MDNWKQHLKNMTIISPETTVQMIVRLTWSLSHLSRNSEMETTIVGGCDIVQTLLAYMDFLITLGPVEYHTYVIYFVVSNPLNRYIGCKHPTNATCTKLGYSMYTTASHTLNPASWFSITLSPCSGSLTHCRSSPEITLCRLVR